MWPPLLCSIVVVAISIERFITSKADRIIPSGLLAVVWQQQLRNKELQGEQLTDLVDALVIFSLPVSVTLATAGIL